MFKKKDDFLFFSKNIYLFITIYFVAFKVIPLRCYTFVPALFPFLEALLICAFWYGFELFQRCSLYLLNRGKSPSFHESFQFWEQEKVARDQVRWLRHDYNVVFGQKNHEQATTCELAHYRGAISMTSCSTILGVFFVLLHANGA